MFRKPVALVAVTTAALLLSGCTGQEGSSSSGSTTLTLGAIVAPLSFDPAAAEWDNRSPYFQATFDTLLRATADGEPAPFLATEWSYNDDNTVLTMTVRNDVTFSDGSALTADVVKQNLDRFKAGTSPDAGTLANMMFVDVVDDTTVTIALAVPDPAFLSYLTRSTGVIGSAESFDEADLATHPIGSGPYILDIDATVVGSSYVYTKNPDYWDPELQHYDGLTINVYSDPTAALNVIKGGQANGMKLVGNNALDEVEGAGWTVNANEPDFQGLLLLDRAGTLNPALGDVRVRQAINYAMDREGLLTAVQDGYGTLTEQVFGATSDAFDASLDDTYDYDPGKARDLLAEAGFADGLTIAMPSSSIFGNSVFTLVAQLLDDVGITVEYTEGDAQTFITGILGGSYPATFMQLQQSQDWQLIQFMISPTATFNPLGFQDPTADALMLQVQVGNEATAAAAAKELNAYIVDQAWFAPFYRVQGSFATDANTEVTMLPTASFPAIYDFQPRR